VPAYKAQFLRETLKSIAAQTDRNFQLYVFDDAGPEAVGQIVHEFKDRLPLKYHRFRENLGGRSLVKHWERCLQLTDEPWIWIFSDDDLMDEGCVAAFHKELDHTREGHDGYRFDTLLVSSAGARLKESPRHPDEESGSTFLLERWRETRDSFLQGLIFSRRAWKAGHGIPDFPLGWHSDDAFIAMLGLHRPLKSIPGPRVSWRASNINISYNGSVKNVGEKIRASAQFIRWALDFFEDHAKAETAQAIEFSERWFFTYVSRFWCFMGLRTCREIEDLAFGVWGYPRGRGLLKGIKLNFNIGVEKIMRRARRTPSHHAKNSLPDQPRS